MVYIARGHEAVAVSLTALAKRPKVEVCVGTHKFEVRFRLGVGSALDRSKISAGQDVGSVTVTEDGHPAVFSEPFWFAVAAFRPDVKVVRSRCRLHPF